MPHIPACGENDSGASFGTIHAFRESHPRLNCAQALFTNMKDSEHTAQVDETRAQALLAEGRLADAERIMRAAVRTLEQGGRASPLARALTTHGLVLARMGNRLPARLTLQRAIEVAEQAGDAEAAGLAALTVVEELGEHLPPQDLAATYDRAARLLSGSPNQEGKDRLLACSRRVLFLVASSPAPPDWRGFDFFGAVLRYEARIIERALDEAGGVVARAAELLGIGRQSLDSMLHRGRHRELLRPRAAPRRGGLTFRGGEADRPDARAVAILHVEDHPAVADAVREALEAEGWSIETCGNGAAALARLESGARYDVLIFDYYLPDMSGVELVRRARALTHRRQTPIIVLSGDDVESAARRAGAGAFLRKPNDVPALAETVARLLAHRPKGR